MSRGLIGAAAALLAGIAVGAYGSTVARAPAAAWPPVHEVGVATSAVFHRAQVDADLPDLPSTGGLRRSSFRRLGSVPSERTTLYAAMDRSGEICLVSGPGLLQAACASPAAFDSGGLELQFQGNGGPLTAQGVPIDRVLAEWLPSGQVGFAITHSG